MTYTKKCDMASYSGVPSKRTRTLINFSIAVLNKETIFNVLTIILYVVPVRLLGSVRLLGTPELV